MCACGVNFTLFCIHIPVEIVLWVIRLEYKFKNKMAPKYMCLCHTLPPISDRYILPHSKDKNEDRSEKNVVLVGQVLRSCLEKVYKEEETGYIELLGELYTSEAFLLTSCFFCQH